MNRTMQDLVRAQVVISQIESAIGNLELMNPDAPYTVAATSRVVVLTEERRRLVALREQIRVETPVDQAEGVTA